MEFLFSPERIIFCMVTPYTKKQEIKRNKKGKGEKEKGKGKKNHLNLLLFFFRSSSKAQLQNH